MADVSFDDLIPQQPAGGGGGAADLSFDDLIPQQAAPAEKPAVTPAKPGWRPALEAFGSNYLDVPTLGGATALRAGIGSLIHGTSYPEEYQRIREVQESAKAAYPKTAGAGTAAGLGVAMAPVSQMARLGALPKAALRPAAALERAGTTATGATATGAAAGALEGYGETGTAEGALAGAGMGAVGSLGGLAAGKAIAPAVGAAGRAAGMLPKTAAKTAQEIKSEAIDALKNSARLDYDRAKSLGAWIKPQSMQKLSADVERTITQNSGYSPNVAAYGKVKSALDDLYKFALPDAAGKPRVVELDDLEKLRRKVNNTILTDIDKSTRQMGFVIRNKIDDFMDNLGQHAVSSQAGGAQAAADAIAAARPKWKQARKAEDLENAIERAKLRAESTYSGGNLDNAIRQNLRRFLEKDLQTPGKWTSQEKLFLRKAVKGSAWENILRLWGNKFAPSGLMGGIEGAGAIGAHLLGAPHVALGLGALAGSGAAARSGARALRQRSYDSLLNEVLGGRLAPQPTMLSGLPGLPEAAGRAGVALGARGAGSLPLPRAAGGRVGGLLTEADRACKRLGGATKAYMDMPDEHVVHALRLAKGG